MLVAAGAASGIVYVATPITTGRFALEGVASGTGISVAAKAEARRENELRAHSVAEHVRTRLRGTLVVNPAAFEAGTGGWTQEDFYGLWTSVITKFARRVVVVAGWEFSKGARLEVQLALRLGIPVWDEELFEVIPDQLVKLARHADDQILELCGSVERVSELLGPALELGRRAHSIGNFELIDSAAAETYWWLTEERTYQVQKFGVEFDDSQTTRGPQGLDSPWFLRLGNYVQRSVLFGLESAQGRQALAKAAATCAAWVESAVRLYGPLPQPGVPSGDGIEAKSDSRLIG